MSRAKTVCLTFRDFLEGPVVFQVPTGYRRLQLNHFSVSWDTHNQRFSEWTSRHEVKLLNYITALNQGLYGLQTQFLPGIDAVMNHTAHPDQAEQFPDPHYDDQFLKNGEVLNQMTTVGLKFAPNVKYVARIPAEHAAAAQEAGIERNYLYGIQGAYRVKPVNPPELPDGYEAGVGTTRAQPGAPLQFPWIPLGEFKFPAVLETAATLIQKRSAQMGYASTVPTFIQLNCTGLGAWRDTIAVCPYPGELPPLGMQGNTFEITNTSLVLTVMNDCGELINNTTLIVQFTLL